MRKRKECKDIEWYILKYANHSRDRRGISPIKSNWGLRNTARAHSNDMAHEGGIWHGDGISFARNSLTYKSFWDFLIKTIFYKKWSGENVGLMCRGRVKGFKHPLITAKDIAYAMHKSWMRSPGHRANILNPAFSLIGVGVVRKENKYYCTQLFYG